MHSSSVAGREIFVSHNSGRVTAYTEVTPKWSSVRIADYTEWTPSLVNEGLGDFATIEKHATSISILLQPSLTNTFVPKVFSVAPKHTSFVMQCDQRI